MSQFETGSQAPISKFSGNVAMSAQDILANGYDLSRIPHLEAHFEKLVQEGTIHGACWAMIHKGNLISNGAIGAGSAVDARVPMKPDIHFRIASITKIFTTVALMILAEEGKINLGSTVTAYVPEVKFWEISVWSLLTHTSGLYPDGDCFPDDHVKSQWGYVYDAARIHGENFNWITEGLSAGKRRETGKEWMYCTFGFMILGEVITRVSGQKAEDFIMERVVKPMGLDHTGFDYTTEMAKHMFIRGEWHQKRVNAFLNGETQADDSEDAKIDRIVQNKLPAPGNGLKST
ncbi:MAG: beta-lactamase family protein, partial [Clostridium sp.]|nr:beta-lactamase family protein [Clostridium sp.]